MSTQRRPRYVANSIISALGQNTESISAMLRNTLILYGFIADLTSGNTSHYRDGGPEAETAGGQHAPAAPVDARIRRR